MLLLWWLMMAAGLNSLAESVSMSHSTSCLNLVSAYEYEQMKVQCISHVRTYLNPRPTGNLVYQARPFLVLVVQALGRIQQTTYPQYLYMQTYVYPHIMHISDLWWLTQWISGYKGVVWLPTYNDLLATCTNLCIACNQL